MPKKKQVMHSVAEQLNGCERVARCTPLDTKIAYTQKPLQKEQRNGVLINHWKRTNKLVKNN